MEEIELSSEPQREQAALQASTERLRSARLELEVQNRAIQALIEHEEQLAAQLREVHRAFRGERQAIEVEKSRVLNRPRR